MAPTAPDRQPDEDAEQDEVHDRIRHGHELLLQRKVVGVDIWRDEEDPRHRADPHCDDQGVDQAGAVAAGVPAADQEKDANDEEGVDGQIQSVPV